MNTKKKLQTPVSLPIAEREKIINAAVEEFKIAQRKEIEENSKNGKSTAMHFSMNGEGATRTIRDFWQSDMAIHCLQKVCVESLRMPLKLAISIVTGKSMFIGDTRVSDLELVDDDGRFTDEFENYSIEEMINRHENNFVKYSNHRAELTRIINMLKDHIVDEDDPIQIDSDSNSEWLSPNEIREKIKKLDALITKHTDELDFLYPIVKKTLRDLPISKIGTSNSGIESELAKSVGTGMVQKKAFEEKAKKIEKEKEEARKKKREEDDAKEERRLQKDIEDNRHLITPITDEQLASTYSCWILPDGTMFGGRAIPFIHDHIIFFLKQTNFFKDDKIEIDEDTVETMGWIKLSGGHGFMSYKVNITEAQRLKILDWAIAHEEEKIIFNSNKIDVKDFINLHPEDIRDFAFRSKSKSDDDDFDVTKYFPEEEKIRRQLMTQAKDLNIAPETTDKLINISNAVKQASQQINEIKKKKK